MQDSTKGMLLIAGLATLAGAVYLMGKASDNQTKVLTAKPVNDTAKTLIKSAEAVINMPEKTAQVLAKETTKATKKISDSLKWLW